MGAALVLLLVGLGAMAAGVLVGRYYVPDDRQLRRTARHSKAYMRALSHLLARDQETAVSELRSVVEENVEDVEPYFALGAMFRSRGEHERAIRVHQALAVRERDRRKLRQRAMYELGLDFRAAGMPRRATRAMEEVVLEEPGHEGALRVLAALYEEQARFNEAAELWQRLGRRRGEDTSHREHHLLVAAAQSALGRDDLDSAKQLLKAAQKLEESAHFFAAAAELAAARNHHRDAKERLKQALIAEPALAPHLLPGLIAAEQGLAVHEGGAKPRVPDEFDDAELASSQLEAAEVPQLASRSTLALPSIAAAASGAAAAPPAAGYPGSASSTTSPPAHAISAAAPQVPVHAMPPTGGTAPAPIATAVSVDDTPPTAPQVSTPSVSSDAAPSPEAAVVARTASIQTEVAPSPEAAALARARSVQSDVPPSSETAVVARVALGEGRPGPRNRTLEIPSLAGTLRLSGDSARDASAPSSRDHSVSLWGSAAGETLSAGVAEGVLAVLAEVEAQTGPRLELALIRAQLVPAGDDVARAELVKDLVARFRASLAARVAAARLALANEDPQAIRGALDGLVSDGGAVAWALHGRWQCIHCGHRPGPFSWRCGQCRRWDTLRMETGVEPPPVAPRERRGAPRSLRPDGLLGATPDDALPAPTLDPGLSDVELASGGIRRSLLGKVGGWVSGLWRRGADTDRGG